MDNKNKKEDILQTIRSTTDEQLIEEVYELLHPAEAIDNIAIKDLPEELQDKLSRALADYKSGRYITHDQMKQKSFAMAYQIVWSAEAENDFKTIILYLKENWSQQSSEKFIERTYRKLERLAEMPSIARTTTQQSVFIFKLDNKNVLFFLLEENHLVLLSIYPFKKDITKSKYY